MFVAMRSKIEATKASDEERKARAAEAGEFRREMKSELEATRKEIKAEIEAGRMELILQMGEMRRDMNESTRERISTVEKELTVVRARIHNELVPIIHKAQHFMEDFSDADIEARLRELERRGMERRPGGK